MQTRNTGILFLVLYFGLQKELQSKELGIL